MPAFKSASDYQRVRDAMRFTHGYPHSGKHFFVNAVTGSTAATYGYTPDAPLTTIDAAIGYCTAANGDVIHILPGHTDTVSGAGTIAADVSGVTFQGHGNGRNRPVISWTTAIGAQMTVSAANVTFRNLVMDFTGFDAITAAISVTGADVVFEDCDFITNSATAGVVLGILTAATATRFRVSRCRFLGTFANTGTTTTAQIKHEVGVNFLIEDSYFCGKMTQAILNATTITNGHIDNNRFHVGTGTVAITMETSSAGLISRNVACVASGTAPYAGAAMSYSQNHYTTEANGPTAGTADAI